MIQRTNKPFLAILTMAIACSAAQAADITVYVDGDAVQFGSQGPRMLGERVYVPLRGVFEKLGVSVDWDEGDQTITCEKPSKKIWLKIGDREAKVDNMPVTLDQPALLFRGTTMVPLRFVSESLGADVRWNNAMQAVNISTNGSGDGWSNGSNSNNANNSSNTNTGDSGVMRNVSFDSGTVVPVILDTSLSSKESLEGDKFTATVGTKNSSTYGGLPAGTVISGHVVKAQAKEDKEPGVLAVDFDAIVMPNGTKIPIQGSLIGLDNKSVETKDDLIIAKSGKSDNDHKNVWIGAGAGAVIALITKSNLLTTTVIGAGLGYLYDQLKLGGSGARDVTLNKGTAFGVKLDKNFYARVEK